MTPEHLRLLELTEKQEEIFATMVRSDLRQMKVMLWAIVVAVGVGLVAFMLSIFGSDIPAYRETASDCFLLATGISVLFTLWTGVLRQSKAGLYDCQRDRLRIMRELGDLAGKNGPP